jgi:hypothetical protein
LSKIFDISDVTISKTYKKIVPYRKYIMNDDVSEKLFININKKNHKEYIDETLIKIDQNIFKYKIINDKYKYFLI